MPNFGSSAVVYTNKRSHFKWVPLFYYSKGPFPGSLTLLLLLQICLRNKRKTADDLGSLKRRSAERFP
ncbi:hypothetical protein PSTEL_18205 [Paenibacillus stellifer]|uniref:Uncharacterized protein n=1 Tax=Paenibacillus stellifer TaxID=169760 RepID=A0A089LZQ4_9BACL|nr:hypothetical protein PSTEL_18205 [Paenibacillus stellifer]